MDDIGWRWVCKVCFRPVTRVLRCSEDPSHTTSGIDHQYMPQEFYIKAYNLEWRRKVFYFILCGDNMKMTNKFSKLSSVSSTIDIQIPFQFNPMITQVLWTITSKSSSIVYSIKLHLSRLNILRCLRCIIVKLYVFRSGFSALTITPFQIWGPLSCLWKHKVMLFAQFSVLWFLKLTYFWLIEHWSKRTLPNS